MEDADGSKYRLGSCKQFTQALHCVQVMLLPVSNINVNFCGGVPKATSTRKLPSSSNRLLLWAWFFKFPEVYWLHLELMKLTLDSSGPKISWGLGGWEWPDPEHGPYFCVIGSPWDPPATHNTYIYNSTIRLSYRMPSSTWKHNILGVKRTSPLADAEHLFFGSSELTGVEWNQSLPSSAP